MSDFVRPHRWQPTRLPRPWYSPGKNTGVGCHFLLQCKKVKSESEVAQSCPTLSDPMDSSLPGSSVHGIFQARLTGVGCHFLLQGIFPIQGSNLGLLHCRHTLLPFEPPGKSKLRTYQTPTLFHTPPWNNTWPGSGGSAQNWWFYHCQKASALAVLWTLVPETRGKG